ncbi:MAG TPA: hypothetical protein VK501_14865 [Baekduia sp.]|uniref:hypothetical protein n=1 Tax=Baekduia sp. TaxID=2600305 RepID=UPI002BA1903F|nr:hypothetical protein [Baekduia sp.]HMJ35190.1 hypothetical protein [Baekduia sp.]
MNITRTIARRGAALGTVGALALGGVAAAESATSPTAAPTGTAATQGWGAYGPETVISGSFSISPSGTVTGTLPPGYTKARPPVDAAAPETAARIRASTNTAGLSEFAAPTASAAHHRTVKARAASNPAGCVTAFSTIDSGGLSYKGQMAGCRYGHLWLHTYLNANGVRVDDYPANDCYNTTSCSVPYTKYTGAPNCRQFVNYAHGINRTTGGDDTAYQVHNPWAC